MNHASDEKSKSITLMWPRKWWAPWRRGRRRRRRRRHSPDPGEQLGFRLLIFFLISGRLIAIPHLDFFSCAFAFDSHWVAFQCCVLCTASLFPFIYIIYPIHLIYPFNWIVPHKGLPKIIKKISNNLLFSIGRRWLTEPNRCLRMAAIFFGFFSSQSYWWNAKSELVGASNRLAPGKSLNQSCHFRIPIAAITRCQFQ